MSNKNKFWKDKFYWLGKELIQVYSSHSSFFSKKRLESSVAFVIGQWGMIFWLIENHTKASISDISIWAGIQFAISGYILTEIQKEKKLKNKENTDLSHQE
jgi:hypothetical protein